MSRFRILASNSLIFVIEEFRKVVAGSYTYTTRSSQNEENRLSAKAPRPGTRVTAGALLSDLLTIY